tara:strand:+ start:534 stop:638 length:105 start_codon:yes stop_codon:yes gene_type:complete
MNEEVSGSTPLASTDVFGIIIYELIDEALASCGY